MVLSLVLLFLDTYNIASTSGCVGKFCLSKHYYRLGEDVLGTFDLTGSEVSCIKVIGNTIGDTVLLHLFCLLAKFFFNWKDCRPVFRSKKVVTNITSAANILAYCYKLTVLNESECVKNQTALFKIYKKNL